MKACEKVPTCAIIKSLLDYSMNDYERNIFNGIISFDQCSLLMILRHNFFFVHNIFTIQVRYLWVLSYYNLKYLPGSGSRLTFSLRLISSCVKTLKYMKILKAYEDFEGPEGGNYKVSKVPTNRKTHRFQLKIKLLNKLRRFITWYCSRINIILLVSKIIIQYT